MLLGPQGMREEIITFRGSEPGRQRGDYGQAGKVGGVLFWLGKGHQLNLVLNMVNLVLNMLVIYVSGSLSLAMSLEPSVC